MRLSSTITPCTIQPYLMQGHSEYLLKLSVYSLTRRCLSTDCSISCPFETFAAVPCNKSAPAICKSLYQHSLCLNIKILFN